MHCHLHTAAPLVPPSGYLQRRTAALLAGRERRVHKWRACPAMRLDLTCLCTAAARSAAHGPARGVVGTESPLLFPPLHVAPHCVPCSELPVPLMWQQRKQSQTLHSCCCDRALQQ